MFSVILFLISNEVLISLHNCLDSTHTNCPAATRGIFLVIKGKICHFMVIVIATLQKFYNTAKFLYKNRHTNYVEKPAASCGVTN
jgi:hypothetical protein